MEDAPHQLAHFMAVGAGQRLGDYRFLRHTYQTISGQEAQLNRILRLLDEDEINLLWRIDTTPIGRFRSRSLYDFDRTGDSVVLPGSIAYERFRQWEKENLQRQVPTSKFRSSRRRSHDRTNGNGSTCLPEVKKLKSRDLNSFSVDWKKPTGLLCQWSLPEIDLDRFIIEYQIDQENWTPIDQSIDKNKNQIEFDVASLFVECQNQQIAPRFRLKAQLNDGTTVSSDPTEPIVIDLGDDDGAIFPEIENLSADSIRLTWKNHRGIDETRLYDIEKRQGEEKSWEKIVQVSLGQLSTVLEQLNDAEKTQFRLVPSSTTSQEVEADVFTVHNVNEWLSSLRLVPTSSNTVDIEISEEGFKEFDRYKVEYTIMDGNDQWIQMPDITDDNPQLTIINLQAAADYKFRFTPMLSSVTEGNSSHFSLVLDVKMPSTRKAKLVKNEDAPAVAPPQFAIHQIDPTSVFIETIVASDKGATFDDAFDIYSKKDREDADEQWTKIGTIDKDHLNLTIKDLAENTAYVFKISNQSSGDDSTVVQEFQFETASVTQYDPSLFLEKVEQSVENVVNNVMRTAAGHQTIDDPLNISLNQVIKEIFQDEKLVPNEQYGFDTLALSSDLQLFRGPKQMMLQELEINETSDTSKTYGEILIHNLRRGQQPVIVREENGNTRIANIDGDVIIRNVMADVLLSNEETRNQLSMNIVGQAFLKGVQGVLVASNFKGIIVVKTVNKAP